MIRLADDDSELTKRRNPEGMFLKERVLIHILFYPISQLKA